MATEELPKGIYLCQDCLVAKKKRDSVWFYISTPIRYSPVIKIKRGGVIFEVKAKPRVMKSGHSIYLCKSCAIRRSTK